MHAYLHIDWNLDVHSAPHSYAYVFTEMATGCMLAADILLVSIYRAFLVVYAYNRTKHGAPLQQKL